MTTSSSCLMHYMYFLPGFCLFFRDRERNIDVREKHRSVASCTHTDLGTWDGTCNQACALTFCFGNLLLCGQTPNQLSHTAQGLLVYLLTLNYYYYYYCCCHADSYKNLCSLLCWYFPFWFLNFMIGLYEVTRDKFWDTVNYSRSEDERKSKGS